MLKFRRNSLKALSAMALTATIFVAPQLRTGRAQGTAQDQHGRYRGGAQRSQGAQIRRQLPAICARQAHDGTVFHRVIGDFMIQAAAWTRT